MRPESVGPALYWTCAGCREVHHQDENAAAVIRAIGERLVAEGKAATARTRKAAKKKTKLPADGIAVGDRERMVVIPRDPHANAAE